MRARDFSRLNSCAVALLRQIGFMPLIKLNRINRGGEILLNSDHIVFIEIESRVTTVHLTNNLLFSVEESPVEIAARVEQAEVARISNGIVSSGLTARPGSL